MLSPAAISKAAQVLKQLGPKAVGTHNVKKILGSTLIPMTYDIAPKMLAWTWVRHPKVAQWAIANGRAVWEHPKKGMDILAKFDKAMLDSGVRFKMHSMPKAQRVDYLHDAAKARDPIFKGILGQKSVNQMGFGKQPLYTGLEKAIETKGKTGVSFNTANARGLKLHQEAQSLLRGQLRGQRPKNHTVLGYLGGNKNQYIDTWNFTQNAPKYAEGLKKILKTATYYGDTETVQRVLKELGTRALRDRLDSIIDPITIIGSMK